MSEQKITIDIHAYLSEEDIREEAKSVIRRHFGDYVSKSNLPYNVFYEAVKESGFDFAEAIKAKFDIWAEEKSTFTITDSQHFKDQMKVVISENKDTLRDVLLKRISEFDEYDLREHLADAMIKILERK